MAQENNNSGEIDFNSENIFDDFSQSQDIKDDVKKFEEREKKDVYFYLKKLNGVLFFVNILVFLGVLVSFIYIYIQTSDTRREYSFLSPVCEVFLGDVDIAYNTCFGVSSLLGEYQNKVDVAKQAQVENVIPLLGEIYGIENFNLSKKVSFLLEKTSSRVRPLEILSAFDSMKQTFAPIDKSEISCYDISISQGSIFQATCDAYSSDWDNKIIDLDSGNIAFVSGGGTSISRASSFIYFLDNYSDSPFQVINKPKKLSSESVQVPPFTQKTTFQLELQYISPEDLSF